MLEDGTARRLQVTGPLAVTVLVDDSSSADASSGATGASSGAVGSGSGSGGARSDGGTGSDGGGSDGGGSDGGGPDGGDGAPVESRSGGVGHRIAVRNVPVFGTYAELNKSLAADALVNQNLLALAHVGPQPVTVYWRCDGTTCRDTYGLVKLAAAGVGAKPGREQRIDQLEQFRPVLAQQQKEGRRFSIVVIVLGAFAVAIVSTAFIEVRAPQFAMLRALGASRSAVGAIALLENFFTAILVGLLAVVLGVAASYLDPNRFNQIPEIELSELSVPVMLYARTVALTLLIGLLTGLAPAVRAYRSVRAS
jgi:putative ABC transport system permease protein